MKKCSLAPSLNLPILHVVPVAGIEKPLAAMGGLMPGWNEKGVEILVIMDLEKSLSLCYHANMGRKKKIRTTIRNHVKIVAALLEIDKYIFMDLFASLYNSHTAVERFGDLFTIEPGNEKYAEIIAVLVDQVTQNGRNSKKIIDRLIFDNEKYLKSNGYHEMGIGALESEINKNLIPAQHGWQGVGADMLLLYHYSRNEFGYEHLERLKTLYREHTAKCDEMTVNVNVSLNGKLKGSDYEAAFRTYASEIGLRKEFNEQICEEVAQSFSCEYNPQSKTFHNVKRGVLYYFYTKFHEILDNDNYARDVLIFAGRAAAKINRFSEIQSGIIKGHQEVLAENVKLKRINRRQREQLNELKKIESEPATRGETEKEIQELRKQNYYLQCRLEALQEEIAVLEQEKEINKTISENITVETVVDTISKPDVSEFPSIIVSGGTWNSRMRDELQTTFAGNSIEFIPADRTLRNIDAITNADLVIFDTSRHSHGHYALVKKKALTLLHINKSAVSPVKELFRGQDDRIVI